MSADETPHSAFELPFFLMQELSQTQAHADEKLRSPNTHQELLINYSRIYLLKPSESPTV